MKHLAPFISLTLAAGAVLAAAYGCLALSTPARAQSTPPACQTVSDMEVQVESQGGAIVGAATYSGSQTDSLIVVENQGMILLYGFKDGCFVGAIAIEAAEPRTAA